MKLLFLVGILSLSITGAAFPLRHCRNTTSQLELFVSRQFKDTDIDLNANSDKTEETAPVTDGLKSSFIRSTYDPNTLLLSDGGRISFEFIERDSNWILQCFDSRTKQTWSFPLEDTHLQIAQNDFNSKNLAARSHRYRKYLEKRGLPAVTPSRSKYVKQPLMGFSNSYSFVKDIQFSATGHAVAFFDLKSGRHKELTIDTEPQDMTLGFVDIISDGQNDFYIGSFNYRYNGNKPYGVFSFNLKTGAYRKVLLPPGDIEVKSAVLNNGVPEVYLGKFTSPDEIIKVTLNPILNGS